jgi:hypothetical protein
MTILYTRHRLVSRVSSSSCSVHAAGAINAQRDYTRGGFQDYSKDARSFSAVLIVFSEYVGVVGSWGQCGGGGHDTGEQHALQVFCCVSACVSVTVTVFVTVCLSV